MAPATADTKKRLALAIHDFLGTSLKDGTISADDAESVEIAQQCVADVFHVDPTDENAMKEALGGQSLLSIYGVYEKLKGRGAASAEGASSAGEGQPTTPQTSAGGSSTGGSGATAPNPEAEAFKSQGNAAMQAKDYPKAIECYSKALNLAPLNPIYLSNRAAAYSASNKHAEASTDAEMAVAADPKYTKAWSRLGLARFALGDAKGSMEAYGKGIEYEGSGGSPAMKKGYETAKRKVEEEGNAEDADAEEETGARGAGGAPGAGGMPDLGALAGMFGGGRGGGGGMPDLGSIMNNPMFANMAQNLMSNPDMMNRLMSNPQLRQMAEQFGGGGGGAGAGAGAEGEAGAGAGAGRGAGRGGGMPDLSSLMNDPNIAEMARNLMGGGRGGGGAPGGGTGGGRGA